MKNKNIIPIIALGILLTCSCGKQEQTVPTKDPDEIKEEVIEAVKPEDPAFVPEIDQIRSICELSTVKCVYHNVAYGIQYSGTGLAHVGEKERRFMQEYDSEVEISYPVDKISMSQNGTEIHITLPEPVISTRKIPESISKYSYIEEPDQDIQKNPIRTETIGLAVEKADATMMEDIMNNSSLLSTAENQAKYLIENYIRQIGSLTDVEYAIIWDKEPSISSE